MTEYHLAWTGSPSALEDMLSSGLDPTAEKARRNVFPMKGYKVYKITITIEETNE